MDTETTEFRRGFIPLLRETRTAICVLGVLFLAFAVTLECPWECWEYVIQRRTPAAGRWSVDYHWIDREPLLFMVPSVGGGMYVLYIKAALFNATLSFLLTWVLMVGASRLVRYVVHRRRLKSGCCLICGYCLHGTHSERCPECGNCTSHRKYKPSAPFAIRLPNR